MAAAAQRRDQIVERVNLAIINEAYRAVEERVASPQDIDLAMKLGANHPMGPFERAGQLGLRGVVEGLRRRHTRSASFRGPVRDRAAALADGHGLAVGKSGSPQQDLAAVG